MKKNVRGRGRAVHRERHAVTLREFNSDSRGLEELSYAAKFVVAAFEEFGYR